jgi:hypothetical protein
MYIFILSVLLVSFISLCFFKKRFWENRYLVLLISGGVALVATLTVNYATRNGHDKDVKTLWTKEIQVMCFQDSLVDDTFFTVDDELSFTDHLSSKDTTKTTIYSHHLFYYDDGSLRIGFSYGNNINSKDLDNVYIAKSNSDTTAFYGKQRLFYGKRIADFSLPHIKTVRCLYLPPSEYAAIPDSLIKELPFKL